MPPSPHRILSGLLPNCFSLAQCTAEDGAVKACCARRVAATVAPSALCYTLEVSMFHSTDVTVVTQAGEWRNEAGQAGGCVKGQGGGWQAVNSV